MPKARIEREDRWSPLLPEDSELTRAYTVKTTVRRYNGASGWHFANLPVRQSARIRKDFGARARGWGSLRVEVTVGQTTWLTSLFPDSKSGTYLFAVKGIVRRAEGIGDGDRITAQLTIL